MAGCSSGDSIIQNPISDYQSVLSREHLDIHKEYEMSFSDIEDVYNHCIESVYDIIGDLKPMNKNPIRECQGVVFSLLLKRKGKFDYVSPDVQVGDVLTVLQNITIVKTGNIRYLGLFRRKARSNLLSLYSGYLKPYYSGYLIQDVNSRLYGDSADDMISIWKHYIDKISDRFQSFDLVDIFCDKDLVMPSNYNLMIGVLNRDYFTNLIERYDEKWISDSDTVNIKVQDVRASIHLMLSDKNVKKDDIEILIKDNGSQWIVGFIAKSNISPYLVLKTLYPKLKLNNIYHNSNFIVIDTVKNIYVRCSCGRNLYHSLSKRCDSDICSRCMISKYMNIYSKM